MITRGQPWALVLAAGEGTRLRGLTTTKSGLTVPKQYCSLDAGPSLLDEALMRAEAIAPPRRVLTVVARQHRRWWAGPLCSLPLANVIVQPHNKGTAVGLLLPLLHIYRRDPDAILIVLPSDHFVRREDLLTQALRRGIAFAGAAHRHVHLLGIAPEQIDPELGYIVPAARKARASSVIRFVEKPSLDTARHLIAEGALLNMFIMAASARALLSLYLRRHPELVARLERALEQDGPQVDEGSAVSQLYPSLPTLDFSRDLLEGQEDVLRALVVPDCGWSDLGTPRRVAETLTRFPDPPQSRPFIRGRAYLSLSQQQSAGGSPAHA